MSKKVKNNVTTSTAIRTLRPSHRSTGSFVIETSFLPLFCSVRHNHFTNFCMDEKHFLKCLIAYREFLRKINGKTFQELLEQHPHCHPLRNRAYDIAVECIRKSIAQYDRTQSTPIDMDAEQLLSGEKLYQLGIDDSGRYIGTFDDITNVYHLLLFDHHHYLSKFESKNKYNSKNLNYSLI